MPTREAESQSTAATPEKGRSDAVADNIDDILDSDARETPRKRIIVGIGAVVVLVLIVVFGIPWLRYMLAHQSTDDATVDADAVAVTSRINERIDRIAVNTNQPVRRGQLLFVLDDKGELAKLTQAQAQYDLAMANQRTTTLQGRGGVAQASADVTDARAQVPVAQAGLTQARAQVQTAQAQLPAAQAAAAAAAANFARTRSLVGTGDESAQQLDAARAQNAAAAAQLRSAENAIAVARASDDAASQRVAASQAGVGAASGGLLSAEGRLAQADDPSQVEAAKAALELAKQNLSYTHIYSSIDGFVGEKSVEVGQTVAAGMTLMTLIPHHVYITANYKETQMGHMKVGEPVDITVDAYKGVTFHGHVESINPASQNTYALVPAQNATGNFVKVAQRIPVRISIDDQRADMPLRPGMSVETAVLVQ